jgi:hypothetical protein
MGSGDDHGSSRRTSWTLGAVKERNLALEGYCVTKGCGRFHGFNVDQLIATAGAEYVVPEIVPGIVCTKCGGVLEFKLAMLPPGGSEIS